MFFLDVLVCICVCYFPDTITVSITHCADLCF